MNITVKSNKNESKKVVDLLKKLAYNYQCSVSKVSVKNGLFKSEINLSIDGSALHLAELQEKIRLM